MELPRQGFIEAYAMIVDINGFTSIVDKSLGHNIAQHIRDVLNGGIDSVESNNGQVIGFMGDAFFAVLPKTSDVLNCCEQIAKAVASQSTSISKDPKSTPIYWPYTPNGPSLKVSVEYGWMDVSTIGSRAIGEQRLMIGPPINYANRIGSAGEGNRCLIGPNAAQLIGVDREDLIGPFKVEGKKGEGIYTYYRLDLSHLWNEGT
jgi:class 3 adenylate cyclase